MSRGDKVASPPHAPAGPAEDLRKADPGEADNKRSTKTTATKPAAQGKTAPRAAARQASAPRQAAREANKRRRQYNSIDDISRNDVMAAIRDLYASDPEPCDRQTLLGLLRDSLGLGALGPRIRQALSGDIRAAVRRGILSSDRGQYALDCRHIGEYDPDFLREQFLASLGSGESDSRSWITRQSAIRQAARFLGFRRTGPAIQQAFKSAINSALRRGLLEADGDEIRKSMR